MKKTVIVMLGVILLFSLGAGKPEGQSAPRLVTMTGEAEIKAVPDEVVITLTVTKLDMKLKNAKSQNDEIVKKILAQGAEYKIEPKNIQTSQINIYPRYENSNYVRREFIGYEVSKTVVFILKDLARFEEFLSSLLDAGADNINGIQFRTTELRKYKDQARNMAVKAAREKADAVSAELGQKISRPYSITEEQFTSYTYSNTNFSNDSRDYNQSAEAGESTIALGQISIKAKFTVSFELE